MSHRADITIIGAGVVGLAIAAQVASEDREVYVLEKNETFGQEISSRHSGVIHSGIYYPEGSLKAKTCVAGNRILYELCERYGIGRGNIRDFVIRDENDKGLPGFINLVGIESPSMTACPAIANYVGSLVGELVTQLCGEPHRTRTCNRLIKSQLLFQLS